MAPSEQSETPPAPASAPATLGETLRAARLAQDLAIEQLSTELRIEAKQLTALENDRFEEIGVPVFVKGYLKQYGLRLGLDVRDLLSLYYKQTTLKDVQIQPSRTIRLRDERQVTSWVLAAAALATVVVALAAWWWSGGSLRPAPSTPVPAEVTAPAEQPRPAEQERLAPAPSVAPRAAAPEAEPAASPAVEPGGQETPAEAPAVAAADDAAGADDDARAAPVVAVPLQFSFERESWAEVTDARGERLLFGLNAAGRDVTVRGEPPFAIVLGDADAVRLAVDGAPYEIPRAGRQGNLVRFSVDIAEE